MLKTIRESNELFDQSENSVSCDYYTPHEFKKLEDAICLFIYQFELSVYLLIYLNISSLSSDIDDLKIFLALLDTKFDIICI